MDEICNHSDFQEGKEKKNGTGVFIFNDENTTSNGTNIRTLSYSKLNPDYTPGEISSISDKGRIPNSPVSSPVKRPSLKKPPDAVTCHLKETDAASSNTSNSTSESVEEWKQNHLRYGWGSFKPDCLQFLNSVRWFVLFACLFSMFQGYLVNGVINIVLTTLEKRFELSSSKSGLIVSSNDFLAFFLVLVISFYGDKWSKPKCIGAGIVVFGIGSLVFALPHFLSGKYIISSDQGTVENVCATNHTTDVCSASEPSSTSSDNSHFYLFILGNALFGAGATPIYILGATYIDFNSKAKMTSFYLGLIYASASVGVAAGFMLGGQTLQIYTDFYSDDNKKLNLSPSDPRWVGAWWINFLAVGSIVFLITIPMLGFPRSLPGSKTLDKEEETHIITQKPKTKTTSTGWKKIPVMLWTLFCNPTFLFLTLTGCPEGIIVSGLMTFGAKFFEENYNIPAAFAGFLMGIVSVPGAAGGIFLGGYIVKKLKLKCRGIIRLDMIVTVLAIGMAFTFFIQCPTQQLAGVTSSYVSKLHAFPLPCGACRKVPRGTILKSYYANRSVGEHELSLSHSCNLDCRCNTFSYEPVCGSNGLVYFSPCHAGCRDNHIWTETPAGKMKAYKECSCVGASFDTKNRTDRNPAIDVSVASEMYYNNQVPSVNSDKTEKMFNVTSEPDAISGLCPSDCYMIWVVVPLMFVAMMLTFITVSPTQTATIRCVAKDQKSLAVGIQWLLLRLLGTTPGPLILGSIIDSACTVWQSMCGKTGNCWKYEKMQMSTKLFFWWCLMKGASLIFYFLAQYFYKPATKKDVDDNDHDNENDEA